MRYSTHIIFAIATVAFAYFAYNHYQKTENLDPKILAISLMVKNEETAMALTLQPLIDAGITEFLIYDTGSTDNTIAVTREIFHKNNIKSFVIEQGPWVDFSTSRNKALELTEKHFPNATFMLMIDAEWILHGGKELLQFCQQEKNNKLITYSICMFNNDLAMLQDRLFRTKSNVQFVGKVHEWPNIIGKLTVPHSIYFELTRSTPGIEKTQKRWLKDRDILEQEAIKHPNNRRIIATLAQTYLCLKDMPNSIKWHETLISLPNQDSEDLFTGYLYLAMSYQQAHQTDKAILTYLKAFEIRPCRAEPLIKLAELYYAQHDFALAFLFAKHAATIPFPTTERGVIERSWYDFTRYEILSATAHLFKEYELGKSATIKALMQQPNSQSLQKQLQGYNVLISKK